jgi:hypothetical protein
MSTSSGFSLAELGVADRIMALQRCPRSYKYTGIFMAKGVFQM